MGKRETNIHPRPKSKKWSHEIGEIVLAFFVAWLGYQSLALATGTNMPIVAVVSDSMYHEVNDFNGWWNSRQSFYDEISITKGQFENFPMRNGLSRGDLLFVTKSNPKIGDIIIYDRIGAGYTIVHRVVKMEGSEYITKGDNNFKQDPPVSKSQVRGKVEFAIPLLGFPRLVLFAFGI
jgi:signal peptidase I